MSNQREEADIEVRAELLRFIAETGGNPRYDLFWPWVVRSPNHGLHFTHMLAVAAGVRSKDVRDGKRTAVGRAAAYLKATMRDCFASGAWRNPPGDLRPQ